MSLGSLIHDPRIFIPDGCAIPQALVRISHLGIGAHQDDLEFHALHGILECWNKEDRSFGGIICTDGSGSSRAGPYERFTDDEMRRMRIWEQRTAAIIGRYGAIVQLDYASSSIRCALIQELVEDIRMLLRTMRPHVVYTHNLVDKHETHIAVAMSVLAAIRSLPAEERPARLFGFEGWRGLDWLVEEDKVRLDVSSHPNVAASLSGIFDSQIAGGKRYDDAVAGRRVANATLDNPYASDTAERVSYAMEMTSLIQDDSLDPLEFALGFVRRLETDVKEKLSAFC